MHGIPSIGVNMHIDGTEEWEDEEADIIRGNCIDVDFLNYTPELRDTPTVQDALKNRLQHIRIKRLMTGRQRKQRYRRLRQNLISYLMILTLLNTEIRCRTGKHRFK